MFFIRILSSSEVNFYDSSFFSQNFSYKLYSPSSETIANKCKFFKSVLFSSELSEVDYLIIKHVRNSKTFVQLEFKDFKIFTSFKPSYNNLGSLV